VKDIESGFRDGSVLGTRCRGYQGSGAIIHHRETINWWNDLVNKVTRSSQGRGVGAHHKEGEKNHERRSFALNPWHLESGPKSSERKNEDKHQS
jgi:hypothetical protein